MWESLLTHSPLLYFVQSLWRDEAFSVLAARESIGFIVTKLGFEPPVYYALLHYWIRIFGESEIAARSLSFIGFLLSTTIVIEWAHALYKKHWLSWYLPLFFFVNPMLLYYALEVRTYAWYTFFAVLMLYTYTKRRWVWFTVAAILGFYTHVYLLPFIGILGIHYIWTFASLSRKKQRTLRSLLAFIKQDNGIRSMLIIAVLMMPWVLKIGWEATRMRSSWYFPVDWQLVKSVLGNLFIGYEGTPWYGWRYTAYLSLCIAGASAFALTKRTQRKHVMLLILFGAIPLVAIVGISFFQPLFVNRYLIPVTIAEVLLMTAAIAAFRNPWLQKVSAGIMFAGVLWFNWWYPPQHPKLPIRDTFEHINALVKDDDIILANDPLIYFETLYYAKDRSRVYLYNPGNDAFPWYIGDALIKPQRMIRNFPAYPNSAFLVHTDASFNIVYRIPL